ncbi:unnamed protein product [Didymodactylos carnosus]|uniref:Uncharacterized protein n=1 Tax=Didymodactylos carnosus TaxID=1234261 RepID=A0A8S2E5W7_9BILA|nr:unnamed protein product [Didymodactylos carnosus]CAF3857049.1 unnamed protein product [Didymodactylos carnosus]
MNSIFDGIDLKDQLIVLFINSPHMIYIDYGLKNLYCYELKLINTNPLISIRFFINSTIKHLIIQNDQFKGFLFDSNDYKYDIKIYKLTITEIVVRHLDGKYFPLLYSLTEFILNSQTMTTINSYQLAKKFPNLKSLTLFSHSIQHITSKMFQSFYTLKKLTLNGITTIENEGLFNLKNLEELNLGSNILRLDPFAFYQLGNDQTFLLLLNNSFNFKLNDDKHFCTFALLPIKTFVKFSSNLNECTCTHRYIYRHIEKSQIYLTPKCYQNSTMSLLAQEENKCQFEQYLLQCKILPNNIFIYGKQYNSTYFYLKQKYLLYENNIFLKYKTNFIIGTIGGLALLITFIIVILLLRYNRHSYSHLNRLLRKRNSTTMINGRQIIIDSEENFDHISTMNNVLYHRTNGIYIGHNSLHIPLSSPTKI